MSRTPVGARVGAIVAASVEEVQLLGYGVYEGDFVPDKDARGGMVRSAHRIGIQTPRIRLDSGAVVYGCQCHWGPQQEIKDFIGDRTVVLTTLEESFPEDFESKDSSPA